jgi:hypothetical protein
MALANLSPRGRDMLAACELSRQEVARQGVEMRLLLAQILAALKPPTAVDDSRSSTTTDLPTGLILASPATASPVPALRYEEESGYWDRLVTALTEVLQKAPPPQCPPLTINVPPAPVVSPDILDRVVHYMTLWQSDQAGVLIIGYAWGVHEGRHRWLLLLPAFMVSPRITMLWIGLVLFTRTLRGIRNILARAAGLLTNRWTAWLCLSLCPTPAAPSLGKKEDPEVNWIRRAVSFFTASVVSPNQDNTTLVPSEVELEEVVTGEASNVPRPRPDRAPSGWRSWFGPR